MRGRLFLLLLAMTPMPALAHEGHGTIEAASIWHWLLEFDHSGWLLPALVVLILLRRWRRE